MHHCRFGAVLALTVALSPACEIDPCSRLSPQRSQCGYDVEIDSETPDGIRVDADGLPYDGALLDRLTTEVETCVEALLDAGGRLPKAIREAAWCEDHDAVIPIPRTCLKVKIASDWVPSCADPRQQLLPMCPANPDLCRAKGLEPTPECPCLYRAGVQDKRTIVTAPNLYVYKDPLLRLVTGCSYPWSSPELTACMHGPPLE